MRASKPYTLIASENDVDKKNVTAAVVGVLLVVHATRSVLFTIQAYEAAVALSNVLAQGEAGGTGLPREVLRSLSLSAFESGVATSLAAFVLAWCLVLLVGSLRSVRPEVQSER